jgi:large subunit ribosomal protein L6
MSRIGKKIIPIPAKVDVKVDGNTVIVKGPQHEESMPIPAGISVNIENNNVHVLVAGSEKKDNALHGLCRSLINNMILGVNLGFTRVLNVVGVGYKAEVRKDILNLQLGHSHEINFPIPQGIDIKIEKLKDKNIDNYQTSIIIKGSNKQAVGLVSSKIRSFRPPEIYKGKGVRYDNEVVKLKQGKATGA